MSNLTPTEISGYSKKNAALVNTDQNALESYKKQKNKDRRIAILEEQVKVLSEQVGILMAKASLNG